MKYPLSAFLIFGIILTAGCVSSGAAVVDLEPGDFADMVKNGNVFVIDTHVPEQDHIKGTDAFIAYNEIEKNFDKLPADKSTPIGVYCRSGSMSSEAAQTLLGMGYTKVYNLAGGTDAWRGAGLAFDNSLSLSSEKVTVYKSASCGCCVGYIAELKEQGFDVETVSVQDMSPIKENYGVPYTMQSCHTAIVDDYFVEGHVPIEAVKKMLEEKPDIDGISLPGMPAGSPGMPGIKAGLFHVYALSDGVSSDFARI